MFIPASVKHKHMCQFKNPKILNLEWKFVMPTITLFLLCEKKCDRIIHFNWKLFSIKHHMFPCLKPSSNRRQKWHQCWNHSSKTILAVSVWHQGGLEGVTKQFRDLRRPTSRNQWPKRALHKAQRAQTTTQWSLHRSLSQGAWPLRPLENISWIIWCTAINILSGISFRCDESLAIGVPAPEVVQGRSRNGD